MLAGGAVAAAIGAGASPSIAESVAARSGEIVAREAPGSGQAGIAVIRGTDRVRLLGERNDWSEILLPDGRRAWVPTGEVTRVDEAPRPKDSPAAAATPAPTETKVASAGPDVNAQALAAEVGRLRGIVDQLALWRPNAEGSGSPITEEATWMIAGAALIVGLLLGSAWERHRNRRDRALRF